MLITDHNVRETLGICDRAYILAEGTVLAQARRRRSWTTPTYVASTLGIPSSCDRRRRVPFLPFGTGMKTRLQTSLGQQLVLTPQLQQAIKLLQMSTTELELEIAQAVESNPLLDWADSNDSSAANEASDSTDADAPAERTDNGDDWAPAELDWSAAGSGGSFDDDDDTGSAAERVAETETLADHLLWQLHLSHLSTHDRSIGAALIDALDDDGYLREPLATIAETLPAVHAGEDEILAVLHRIQRFDPVGVAARTLGECLQLQLDVLPADAGAGAGATIAAGPLERLPRSGVSGLAHELKQPLDEVETAVARCARWTRVRARRSRRCRRTPMWCPTWCVAAERHLARSAGGPCRAEGGDPPWLRTADPPLWRGRRRLPARPAAGGALAAEGPAAARRNPAGGAQPDPQQAGFLEFGEQALRPLTLREIAAELGLHESTVSRAIARKHVRTPRGTLRAFASGIDTEGGGEASSTAIQAMIRRLIDDENPRKPLSDAKLADLLKSSEFQ